MAAAVDGKTDLTAAIRQREKGGSIGPRRFMLSSNKLKFDKRVEISTIRSAYERNLTTLLYFELRVTGIRLHRSL